ncbi:MAG TPA: MFS transporter [Candidatus Limnocylindrales bacterium]|nr:MFS transporter [Candidatus Limnocylindrales bacterium]
MNASTQKLSFLEKAGYSGGDAAANFVFMSMILFQANFYTDVFGLTAGLAGTIILVARLWDAFFDPLMGVLADRTQTRWGRFRPWVLWTSLPWAVVMVLAYTTPNFGHTSMIIYAFVTNILLMTLYSANNMPYSALGAVMTGDVQERAKLNSFRFVAVNIAQFIVGGFTLTLVAKFAGADHNKQRGWSITMGIWAVLCLVLFLITFFTTKERVQPISQAKSSPKQDFAALLKNNPWKVMFFMTLVHFAILSFRGGALYNYYHNYADKAALYDWVASLHLTAAPLAAGAPAPGGILEWLGYIVHAERSDLSNSNVADVANSLINMIGTGVTIIVILLSPALARKFGKKTIAVAGFALACVSSLAFYLLSPTNIGGMVALTVIIAIVYAPTIPLVWAIYADVADYSEWKTGRRFTGIVFATIGFALKCGLALGSASFLWIMAGFFNYDPKQPPTAQTLEGFRACSSLVVGLLFGVCTVLLLAYQINKRMTNQMADELADRRENLSAA